MEPRISVITLGVTDLARSRAFYKDGLSLPEHSASNEGVAFFVLRGTWLGLYPRKALVEDLGLKPRNAFGPVRVAVTGRRISPPLFESLELLGRTRSLSRHADAQDA